MDSAKFKKIFSKENYQLPIRWDGKDFYSTLYKHLKNYREDIEKNCDNPNLCAEVKTICRIICAAVDHSFRGYPGKAYKSFEAVMEILIRNPLLIDEDDINKEPLYRVVDVGNAAVPKRQRVFHVPFNMRSKMSTQRYSIPGFPSLYLGTSLELCLMEIGKDPKRDYVCVSRYELQTDSRRDSYLLKIDPNPLFDNDEFIIFDISIKPEEAIKKLCNDEDFVRYIKWYPLISACSYIRAVRDDHILYSPEYIVSQLFIQWVRSEDEDAVVGIKYFSCAPVYASTLGNNYVFPTTGTPHHARKTINDYCARLSHRFKLTSPKFLMEYDSIADCVEAMKKDVNLTYIEDYNIGEGEEIKEDYKIPEGVSLIGAFAFHSCISLPSISIPDSVTTIGESAFKNCSNLSSINIPDGVTSIGKNAFSHCNSLKNIIVDSSNGYYTSVDGVLYNKNKTNLICYPAGKKQPCFEIPDDVTSIEDGGFSGCSSLASIIIPDGVTSIGENAFGYCNSLININIPDSVTTIEDFTFLGCNSLTSISIPDSVITIKDYVFLGCSSLRSINISESVTFIGKNVFHKCDSLNNITVNSSNKYFASEEGILYNKSKTKLLYYPTGKNHRSLAIPLSVTSIGEGAFWGCSSLTSINISNSVLSIGDGAFYGCSSIDTVYYSGTKEQAEKVRIGTGNEELRNAHWVYGSLGSES